METSILMAQHVTLQAASQFPSCSHPAIAVWRFRSAAAPPPGPSHYLHQHFHQEKIDFIGFHEDD